jgi:hypothetical protein
MDIQARFRDIEKLQAQVGMSMKGTPELRLGQIIVNALMEQPEELHTRLFYIEDKDLGELIIEYAKEVVGNASRFSR